MRARVNLTTNRHRGVAQSILGSSELSVGAPVVGGGSWV